MNKIKWDYDKQNIFKHEVLRTCKLFQKHPKDFTNKEKRLLNAQLLVQLELPNNKAKAVRNKINAVWSKQTDKYFANNRMVNNAKWRFLVRTFVEYHGYEW